MSLSTAKLSKQENMLYRVHPHLGDLSLDATSLDDAPLEEITRLVSEAWTRAFGNRIRIAYSPAFLRYCAGPGTQRGCVLAARDGEGVAGAILGLPLEARYGGRVVPAVLSTGLCIAERWEGRGLVELLMLRHGQQLIEAGTPCGFHWRSSRSARARDAGARLAQAVRAPLYAKALHIRAAARYGALSRREQMGLWGIGLAEGVRRWRRMPWIRHEVRPLDAHLAEGGAALLEACRRDEALSLPVSAERLLWNCTFSEDGIRGAGWAGMAAGGVCAAAFGYVNPVDGENAYFSMDRVAFSGAMDTGARRDFMAAVERRISSDLNCFAVLMPGNVCDESPARLGYRAVKPYYLGATDICMEPPLTPEHLARLALPLR